MKNYFYSTCVFLLSNLSFGQVILFEESFDNAIPSTFAIVDNDGLTTAQTSYNFNNAWIHYVDSSDSCAASTSFYDPIGASSDYLILPKVSLGTYSKLTWQGKSVDASYPESYVVLISSTDSLIDSFTDTLYSENEEKPMWEGHGVFLNEKGYNNQDVFIAIKNTSNNKFILLIDNIKISISENASISKSDLNTSVYLNVKSQEVKINTTAQLQKTSIYNLLGKEVLSSPLSNINVQYLIPGTYIVKIKTDEGFSSQKITKL